MKKKAKKKKKKTAIKMFKTCLEISTEPFYSHEHVYLTY